MSGFDRFDEREQQEWAAQERAMRAERNGGIPNCVRDMQYRRVARALRQPKIDPIPSNFAHQVATQIERIAAAMDERFEVALQRILIVGMVLAGGITAAMLGATTRSELIGPFERPFAIGLHAFNDWGLVAALCIALSWIVARVGALRRES